jgi:hypothetical protein
LVQACSSVTLGVEVFGSLHTVSVFCVFSSKVCFSHKLSILFSALFSLFQLFFKSSDKSGAFTSSVGTLITKLFAFQSQKF